LKILKMNNKNLWNVYQLPGLVKKMRRNVPHKHAENYKFVLNSSQFLSTLYSTSCLDISPNSGYNNKNTLPAKMWITENLFFR